MFRIASEKVTQVYITVPLWEESNSDWQIPLIKGQWFRKHVSMTRHHAHGIRGQQWVIVQWCSYSHKMLPQHYNHVIYYYVQQVLALQWALYFQYRECAWWRDGDKVTKYKIENWKQTMSSQKITCCDTTWLLWCPKSLTTSKFVQQLFKANNKGNIKAQHCTVIWASWHLKSPAIRLITCLVQDNKENTVLAFLTEI